MSLLQQVEDLETGTTTSVALVTAALDAAEARDGELHAFVRLRRTAALAEAQAADEARAAGDDRPLLGIPLAVKDSHALAGEPAPALGTGVAVRQASPVSDPWVAALAEAGCVPVGQTTMPPLALLPWGPARNPHDPARMAGGSSSGSAAAVAAGIVAVATASDGGGSIRIPAAMCGLFGFKPTPGLIPGPDHWNGLSTSGVLTRTSEETALVLDATIGGGWAAAAATGSVRIGWTDNPATPLGRPTPEVARALAEAVTSLASAGHPVTEATLKLADAAPALSVRLLAGAADDRRDLATAAGGFTLDQPAKTMVALGERVPRRALWWARRRGVAIRERLRALPFDVLVMPTLWSPPAVQDDARLTKAPAVLEAMKWAAWTGAWNVTGLPAASVPVGTTSDGLPLAVQLVDLRGDGHVLFALASQLTGAFASV